jgi:hypothetical protein
VARAVGWLAELDCGLLSDEILQGAATVESMLGELGRRVQPRAAEWHGAASE